MMPIGVLEPDRRCYRTALLRRRVEVCEPVNIEDATWPGQAPHPAATDAQACHP